MSSLYPVGSVLPYAGSLTPTSEAALIAQGYLPCDGRALGNTDPQYQALMKVIGTWSRSLRRRSSVSKISANS